ncbi:hypothetical protein PUR34_04435 [Streptomyces sp. JV185]|uniref:hypothetical protein n=1 Tax=Streptomyces sp. JV185 TaxID=858638 RepID=UPI002E75DAF8|nr:hypothetical protein [Streptomyces sp. JV185]MEE1767444.1 hypothetical protein [Streptomyces sp. JV185]
MLAPEFFQVPETGIVTVGPPRVRDGRTGTDFDPDPDPDGGEDAPAPEARPALRLAG